MTGEVFVKDWGVKRNYIFTELSTPNKLRFALRPQTIKFGSLRTKVVEQQYVTGTWNSQKMQGCTKGQQVGSVSHTAKALNDSSARYVQAQKTAKVDLYGAHR